eukprot:2559535-Alexandrium_andersonii.AAC.1
MWGHLRHRLGGRLLDIHLPLGEWLMFHPFHLYSRPDDVVYLIERFIIALASELARRVPLGRVALQFP